MSWENTHWVKTLAVLTLQQEFGPQNPHQDTGAGACVCFPSTLMARKGGET